MFKLITIAATQIMFANDLELHDMFNKGYKRVSLKDHFTIQLIGKNDLSNVPLHSLADCFKMKRRV